MVDNMSRRGFAPLHYRFESRRPEGSDVTEVADGVFWLRLPMFGRLNHINVWATAGPRWLGRSLIQA